MAQLAFDNASSGSGSGLYEGTAPSDLSDPYALTGDTPVQNLGLPNPSENCTRVSDPRAYRAYRSDRDLDQTFKCYHKGCGFTTNSDQEYRRHGAQSHTKNPLLYPNKHEIEQYGLEPQGKDWEV